MNTFNLTVEVIDFLKIVKALKYDERLTVDYLPALQREGRISTAQKQRMNIRRSLFFLWVDDEQVRHSWAALKSCRA